MNKTLITGFLLAGMLTCFAGAARGQDSSPVICNDCGIENQAPGKFCTNCGESLSAEYARRTRLEQQQRQVHRHFIATRVDPPRLFTVPTAEVLGSLDINLMGGGAFGVSTNRSFLGTFGIGLGNLAEVEFSTVDLVNNIARGATVFTTSAFKLILIPERIPVLPTCAVSFRSSANWQDVSSDRYVLAAHKEMQAAGIRAIDYDTRFTTLFLSATYRWGVLGLHGGFSLTDVRVKELAVTYLDYVPYSDPREVQRNLLGGYFGFDLESNPQTKLMLEVKTVSSYQYNVATQTIAVVNNALAVGGVRFFFTRWLSTDVGVWYHSSTRGIADTQIKLGLNVFVPAGRLQAYLLSRDKTGG